VGFLKQLKRDEDEAAYEALEAELLSAYPKHLPLLSALLSGLASLPTDKRKAKLKASTHRRHIGKECLAIFWPSATAAEALRIFLLCAPHVSCIKQRW
jgi:hypothetical protein